MEAGRDRMLSCLEGRLQHSRILTCSKLCAATAHVLLFSGHTLCSQMFRSVQHRAVRWPAALRVGVAARGREQFREGRGGGNEGRWGVTCSLRTKT